MCRLVSPEMYTREFKVYVCVCAASRSPCLCANRQSVLRDVAGAEPRCARQWAGRTVDRGFTAPSVVNSVKVRFHIEHQGLQAANTQSVVEVW